MTDTDAAARRTKDWEQRGKAIPYRWYERFSDWLCAIRDARTGVATTPAEPRPTTPRLVALGQLGRGWSEREWITYQAEMADVQAQHARTLGRRDEARKQLTEALARLDEMPERPVDADMAAPGEEDSDKEVRVTRRRREHAARRQALADEGDRQRSTLAEAEVELVYLARRIRLRRDVAEVRVAMIEAYVRRRRSAYLVRLARKLPEARRISAELGEAWSEEPTWLSRLETVDQHNRDDDTGSVTFEKDGG